MTTFKRGARPSPRHCLAAATPHRTTAAPACFLRVPTQLSMWLNDVHGDCVTAEEAFAKACCGILISDAEVLAWATAHDVLEGADLASVLTLMQADGFAQDQNGYDDGPYLSVDWTDVGALASAIFSGPVKIGVAADQLQNVPDVGEKNGWIANDFTSDSNYDHCVGLSGYGTIAWLAAQLGVPVPAGVDVTARAYALFTWGTIGIITRDSLLAICGEAWLRSPTTRIVGDGLPTPDTVTIAQDPTPTPSPAPTPAPTPAPAPTPTPTGPTLEKAQEVVQYALYESSTGLVHIELRAAVEATRAALAKLTGWPT